MLNISLSPGAYERLWVVTHQAVILAFRLALEGLTEAQVLDIDRGQPLPNCSATRYRLGADGRWELEAFADASPIEGLAAQSHEPPVTQREPDDVATPS